jgi:energy-coupling factor transporter ATP-binding protein EcfA2
MSNNSLSTEKLLQQILEKNKKQGEKKKQEPIEVLLNNMLMSRCEFYFDRNKTIYAGVNIKGNNRIMNINSDEFWDWLAYECFTTHSKNPPKNQIESAIRIIRYHALQEGQLIKLYTRVASVNGNIYIDLGTDDRKIVKVDASGWKIGNYPIIFKRYPKMLELPHPIEGGQAKEILQFFPPMDEHSQCFVLCWLVASFIEHIERAFLLIEGESGGGKTTLALILKDFIDPMENGAVSYNENENEVAQIIDHQYLPLLDNLTSISRKLSDLMCKSFSGGSHVKKELYTNDKDFILRLNGNIIFTAIELIKPKADFSNRCYKLFIEKTALSNRSREIMMEKFEKARPRIFGALLDTLSKTLEKVKQIEPKGHYRTVDFDRYATAAAEVLGYGAEFFQEARDHCEEIKRKSITNSTPLIEAISGYLRSNNGIYSGNLKKLLQQLPNYTGSPDELPKLPHVLSRRLKEIKPEIDAAGIVYSKKDHNNHNGSQWEFRFANQQSVKGYEITNEQQRNTEESPDLNVVPNQDLDRTPEASCDQSQEDINPFLLDEETINSIKIPDTKVVDEFRSMSPEERDKVLRSIGLK